MKIGNVVKKAIIDKGVTYEFISGKTGFTVSKIGRIANDSNVYLKDACTILDCLDLRLTVEKV